MNSAYNSHVRETRQWTSSELSSLRDLVGQRLSATEIGARLGRSRASVEKRIHRMFPGGSGRRERWSEADDVELRRLVAERATNATMVTALGRDEEAIRYRLGVLFPGGTGRPRLGRRAGDIATRFSSYVAPDGEGGCREWTGLRDADGYGRIRIAGADHRAPRVAWELANDTSIPEGMLVRHTCDNPPCCNAEHLVLGTPAENSHDMVRRGRSARGPRKRPVA